MTPLSHQSLTFEALSANVRAQNALGWQHPRQVAYLHRHPELTGTCLYHWDHQRKQSVPTASQQLCFVLEDIYCEVRGEFNSKKLIVDMDLGLDGKLRLITGLSTQAATSLMASLSGLSPARSSDLSSFESSQEPLKGLYCHRSSLTTTGWMEGH